MRRIFDCLEFYLGLQGGRVLRENGGKLPVVRRDVEGLLIREDDKAHLDN